MKKVIYIAEIDADVDDIIAAEYLFNKGCLMGIVLDPLPKSEIGKQRVEELKKKGIKFYDSIPKCDYIFNGGAFTKLSNYLRYNYAKIIVANGGFVGCNIVKNPLEKFKGKKFIRTFNFNIDVNSTINVLNSINYDKMYLIGKNVCHNEKNTIKSLWKNEQFLKKYKLKDTKRLHDLLMVSEGLKIINNEPSELLDYDNVKCIYKENKGPYTLWGSEKGGKHIAAINWKEK